MWALYPKPEIGLVKHLYRQVDGFRSEVDNERFALELAILIRIHLDSWPTAVDFFCDDAAFGEDVSDLVELNVEWNGGNIHRSVYALFLRFLGIGLPGSVDSESRTQALCWMTGVALTSSLPACFRFFLSRGSTCSSSSTPATLYASCCCRSNSSSTCDHNN